MAKKQVVAVTPAGPLVVPTDKDTLEGALEQDEKFFYIPSKKAPLLIINRETVFGIVHQSDSGLVVPTPQGNVRFPGNGR